MNGRNRFGSIVLAGLAAALLNHTIANADSITPVNLVAGDTLTGTLNFIATPKAPGDYNITVNNTGNSNIYYAGEIGWTEDDQSTFVTFCTQLYTDVYVGSRQTFTAVRLQDVPDVKVASGGNLSSTAAADESFARATMIQKVVEAGKSDLAGPDPSDAAAGIQVAIWKVIYDYNSFDDSKKTLTLGTDTISWGSGAWADDANKYLSAASMASSSTANILGLQSTPPSGSPVQNQSILAYKENPGRTNAVPTPSASVGGLALIALASLGVVRRFRRVGQL